MVNRLSPPLLAQLLRQNLRQGQSPQLEVTSDSMAPLLRQGDTICLEAVTPEQLNRGDVITLETATALLTHRYWGAANGPGAVHLLTRGDRPLIFDPPWPPEALIGRVISRSRASRQLPLAGGAGRWLNRHLCWLAGMEFRLWGDRVKGATSTRSPAFRRGLRGIIYAWATLLTGILGRIA